MVVEQIKEWSLKEGTKANGEQWKAKSVSVKIGDTWYSGFIFEEDWPRIQEGEMDIVTFKREYNGKMYDNWKFNPKSDTGGKPVTEPVKDNTEANKIESEDDLPF